MAKFKEIQIDPVPTAVDTAPKPKRKRPYKPDKKSGRKAHRSNSHTIIVTIFCLIVAIIVAGATWFFGFSEWGFSWTGNTAKLMTQAPDSVVTEYPTVNISMNDVALILEPGRSVKLNADVHKNTSSKHIDSQQLRLKWHSENPRVARVNQKGQVTAVNEGTARVMVTVGNDDINSNTVYCLITVREPRKMLNIKSDSKR